MADIRTPDREWSVGELARACGVTVRALHHYGEIGLLVASERTASGHRRYTEPDLRRLYRIRALQSLGLSLEDVRAALDSSGEGLGSLRVLLEAQLVRIREQSLQIVALQGQLESLLERITEPAMPSASQFMTTLEMITVFEKHFTPEQRQALADRRAELGEERVEAAKTQMLDLVERGLAFAREGRPASDPAVQDLVRQWDAMGSQFHPTEGTRHAARAMWTDNRDALSAGLPWSAAELAGLVEFLGRARG